jgi:ParB family chromosome partitioning protein
MSNHDSTLLPFSTDSESTATRTSASITALVVADREVAWQILALNTEKSHNLKERSLEVIRIYRSLVDEDATRPESQFAFYLDEPALVTLGVCYERFPRFGGAYHSILRRL